MTLASNATTGGTALQLWPCASSTAFVLASSTPAPMPVQQPGYLCIRNFSAGGTDVLQLASNATLNYTSASCAAACSARMLCSFYYLDAASVCWLKSKALVTGTPGRSANDACLKQVTQGNCPGLRGLVACPRERWR